ncbi:hypothetical protein E2562_030152 [Oryza meyeriana var. granulata]|uniref:Uncharacterized protein n=1 Tax=Oryza meyeriana var. granulata TaxID=110450 RepID=A0A6G1BPH3_9ORYZ|nr:hypothetical protein E2562_030152 [Oryza meyeriana var. granulata]
MESSLDIDFSTIPSAWNDDDVASDGVSKGSDEKQVVNENGKLICSSSKPTESGHLASKPSTSPKKDIAVNTTRQNPPKCLSSPAVSESEEKDGDGDYQAHQSLKYLRLLDFQHQQEFLLASNVAGSFIQDLGCSLSRAE